MELKAKSGVIMQIRALFRLLFKEGVQLYTYIDRNCCLSIRACTYNHRGPGDKTRRTCNLDML